MDTSESIIDASIAREIAAAHGAVAGTVHGVTPRLIELLRQALDRAGYGHVKIVASGGFDVEKIRRFEALGVPVDVYGVGSALVGGAGFDHTADIVRIGDVPQAKVGRGFIATDRLAPVEWDALVASDPAPRPA